MKTTESAGPRGSDAGKMVKGRKRPAPVDTEGRALLLEPHAADVQDRDAGGLVPGASRPLCPFIAKVSADGGDNPDRVRTATTILVEIVRKTAAQAGFVVLPAALGDGVFLCLDQPQSPLVQGCRGDD